MKPHPIVFVVTAAFLALAVWLTLRPAPSSAPAGQRPPAPGTPAVTQTGEVIPSVTPAVVGTNVAAPAPATTGTPTRSGAEVEVGKVRRMIVDYHTLMGENPVGTNAEIMHALMGGNPHQATLGPPEGQSLNDKGELVDPWGTPYFFHQLSRDRMEVHSAGPDKIMGTADDIVEK